MDYKNKNVIRKAAIIIIIKFKFYPNNLKKKKFYDDPFLTQTPMIPASNEHTPLKTAVPKEIPRFRLT